jgi:hypothetical protein
LRSLDRDGARRRPGRTDERRIYAITPKFEGYVERLHVNVTGQPVARASRCSRSTARNWSRPSASTRSPRKGVDSLQDAGGDGADGMRQLADSSLHAPEKLGHF